MLVTKDNGLRASILSRASLLFKLSPEVLCLRLHLDEGNPYHRITADLSLGLQPLCGNTLIQQALKIAFQWMSMEVLIHSGHNCPKGGFYSSLVAFKIKVPLGPFNGCFFVF